MKFLGSDSTSKVAVRAIGTLLTAVCVSLASTRAAYAYIDPNTAGSLYQILFPVLVGIASAFAAMRRVIAEYWFRLTRGCTTMLRRIVRQDDGPRS
jgi:hypothetical protein